ncbi:MAG: TonB-dependent receptor plug domain-containing protein [Bacteroidota bacterium]
MKKLLFFVTAVCFSSYLHAQKDTSANNLDEVIVTANRVEQKQSQTGKVVTVIGKEILQRSQGRTLSQVLNEQAGITINGALNNAGTVQTVYMRGANSGRVLVLLDGIPVGDPSFINNEFDLNFMSVNDVERIEIARGAQSTLYGSDAVTGVINIITVKKDINKPLAVKSTLSAGNYNTFRGNVQAYGQKGKFSYQTRLTGIRTGGFSAAYDSSKNQDFDRDGYKGQLASGSVTYQANKQLSFRSFFQYSGYKSDVDGGVFRDDKDFTINNRNVTTGAGLHYTGKGINVTANYQYSQHRRNFLNDSGSISGFSKYMEESYYSRSHFGEVFATIRLGAGFTLLQGFDHRYGIYNSRFFSVSSFGPYEETFPDTSVSQTSLYTSIMYAGPKQKFHFEIGGRANQHNRYGRNETFTFNPTYAFNNNFRLFGSIATGFKAPGLYQLFSSFGNNDLNPEKSINYEIGSEYKTTKTKQRVVLFYREINDGMDFDYINYKYFNFNRQIVRGIEYEGVLKICSALQVSGNYTFVTGSDNTQSRVTFNDTSYNYLLRRPRHQLNGTISYQPISKISLNISARYVSDRFDTGGFASKDLSLSSYWLINAYLDYKPKEWIRFFVDGQNLTNRKFFDLRGFNSIPLMIQAGATFEW